MDQEQIKIEIYNTETEKNQIKNEKKEGMKDLIKSLIENNKIQEAMNFIESIYPENADDADINILKGTCHMIMNDLASAYCSLCWALKNEPDNIEALTNLGLFLFNQKKLIEALEIFKKLIELYPQNNEYKFQAANIMSDVGNEFKFKGNKNEAFNWYNSALMMNSNCDHAYFNKGVLYSESEEESNKAIHCYKKCIECNDQRGDAWFNMGILQLKQNNVDECIKCIQNAEKSMPKSETVQDKYALAYIDIAIYLNKVNRLKEALFYFEKAFCYDHKNTRGLCYYAIALKENKEYEKAINMLEMAMTIDGPTVEVLCLLGEIYRFVNNLEKSFSCYEAGLKLAPTSESCLNNIGMMYAIQGNCHKALEYLKAANMHNPMTAQTYDNIGFVLKEMGDIHGAIKNIRESLKLDPGIRNVSQNLLLALNFAYPGESEIVCKEHEDWGKTFEKYVPRLPPIELNSISLNPNKKLKVGYISPDLFSHSVSYFAAAPLCHHNSDKIEMIVYNVSPRKDEKTELLKEGVMKCKGKWKDVVDKSENDLGYLIRQDKIDILVELTGHTANNKLGTMAMKPAPIQVTWIGYPNTTGLKTIDYRITDSICDPIDTKQRFSEKLYRMPDCFLCYTPTTELAPVTQAPCIKNGYITFGSFNGFAKFTDEVIEVWCKILKAIPNSRMILKNKPFLCEVTKQYIASKFEKNGIEKSRLDLLSIQAKTQDHLRQYSKMDISLDPWPYAGTTTTCESYLMGVPCLSLFGGSHVQNVGASLAHAIGMDSCWIAKSKDEYIDTAIKKASNFIELNNLRIGLRQKMLNSKLCDKKNFIEELEKSYLDMWQKWIKQQKT